MQEFPVTRLKKEQRQHRAHWSKRVDIRKIGTLQDSRSQPSTGWWAHIRYLCFILRVVIVYL